MPRFLTSSTLVHRHNLLSGFASRSSPTRPEGKWRAKRESATEPFDYSREKEFAAPDKSTQSPLARQEIQHGNGETYMGGAQDRCDAVQGYKSDKQPISVELGLNMQISVFLFQINII